MIRTFFAALVMLFFAIFSVPYLIIMWLLGKINMKAHDVLSYGMMKIAFTTFLFICGVKVTVTGRDRIPKDTPVLYVGNHRSYFDIIVAYKYIIGPTGFIAKKEFESVPMLSHWISCLHGLFLDRDNLKEGLKTILQAIDNIKNDKISYVIFPEGTRNQQDEMLPFKEGSMKIATKSGCPIIPFALTHADDIFENHMPFVKKTRVGLSYGEPIYPDQLSKDELKFLGSHVRDLIKNMMDEMP